MKLDELKLNPRNPQKFNDLSVLEKSIKEFPKMMELRPIIYDHKTKIVLGGNKRLICLRNLGYNEIPDNWTKSTEQLNDEEKQKFIITDNKLFGDWNFELLNEDFNKNILENLEIHIPKSNDKQDSFIEEVSKYNDDNCEMPIVPDFFEKHEAFIIVAHNEIDANFVRDIFDLNKIAKSKNDDGKRVKANIIDVDKLKKLWNR